MPRFAKLLARGSCARGPTELAGLFCFLALFDPKMSLREPEFLTLRSPIRAFYRGLFMAAFFLVAEVGGGLARAVAAPQAAESFRTINDDTGRNIRVAMPVRRVVSLSPSMTEIVYALGLQDQLVGDTDYCDYPPDARKKHKVGGVTNPSLEAIAALKPDLVLVTSSNRW